MEGNVRPLSWNETITTQVIPVVSDFDTLLLVEVADHWHDLHQVVRGNPAAQSVRSKKQKRK